MIDVQKQTYKCIMIDLVWMLICFTYLWCWDRCTSTIHTTWIVPYRCPEGGYLYDSEEGCGNFGTLCTSQNPEDLSKHISPEPKTNTTWAGGFIKRAAIGRGHWATTKPVVKYGTFSGVATTWSKLKIEKVSVWPNEASAWFYVLVFHWNYPLRLNYVPQASLPAHLQHEL